MDFEEVLRAKGFKMAKPKAQAQPKAQSSIMSSLMIGGGNGKFLEGLFVSSLRNLLVELEGVFTDVNFKLLIIGLDTVGAMTPSTILDGWNGAMDDILKEYDTMRHEERQKVLADIAASGGDVEKYMNQKHEPAKRSLFSNYTVEQGEKVMSAALRSKKASAILPLGSIWQHAKITPKHKQDFFKKLNDLEGIAMLVSTFDEPSRKMLNKQIRDISSMLKDQPRNGDNIDPASIVKQVMLSMQTNKKLGASLQSEANLANSEKLAQSGMFDDLINHIGDNPDEVTESALQEMQATLSKLKSTE